MTRPSRADFIARYSRGLDLRQVSDLTRRALARRGVELSVVQSTVGDGDATVVGSEVGQLYDGLFRPPANRNGGGQVSLERAASIYALVRGDFDRQASGPETTGRPPAEVTRAETATVAAVVFAELVEAHGLDPEGVAALERFAEARNVPVGQLLRVGLHDRYRGDAKTAAMTAYAIVYDAAHHGKLPPERAQLFLDHVVPSFEQGWVGVETSALPTFPLEVHAQYVGRNQPIDGEAPNTMVFAAEGIDIDAPVDRGVVIHEATHLARDSARTPQSALNAEVDAHRAHAEYRMRDAGALRDSPDGPVIDFEAYQRLMRDPMEDEANKLLFHAVVVDAFDRNVEAGRRHLNGPVLNTPDGPAFVESLRDGPSFEDRYVEARRRRLTKAGRPVSFERMKASLTSNRVNNDGI